MSRSKVKLAAALVAVIAVAVGAFLLFESDDGSEASAPGIGVGSEIRAVAPDDHGRSARKTARIIGGSAVTTEQYPWQVAIASAPAVSPGESPYERQMCGGTLVAPTIVVSAAHCFYDERRQEFRDPSFFTVISGRTKLSSDQGVETGISEYRYFVDESNQPLYSPRLKDWDVVVMVLPVAAIGSELKIAGAGEAQSWAAGATAWVSGWGSTDDGGPGTYPDDLLATSVTILDDARCLQVYRSYDQETSLCAGATAGEHDTCGGDSGGPMVVTLPSGVGRLVGVTSFGTKDCGNVNAPGAYTQLASDPIRSAVQNLVQQLAGVDVVG